MWKWMTETDNIDIYIYIGSIYQISGIDMNISMDHFEPMQSLVLC